MTSQGSAYARFRRALETGNLALVRAAAAELPQVELADALKVCWLVREDPDLYERAVVRWVGRFCLEARDATLDRLDEVLAAFEDLPLHGLPALERLSGLCSGPAGRSRRSPGP